MKKKRGKKFKLIVGGVAAAVVVVGVVIGVRMISRKKRFARRSRETKHNNFDENGSDGFDQCFRNHRE